MNNQQIDTNALLRKARCWKRVGYIQHESTNQLGCMQTPHVILYLFFVQIRTHHQCREPKGISLVPGKKHSSW